MKGVSKFNITLTDAVVDFDERVLDYKLLVGEIDSLGFEAEIVSLEISLTIKGMTCQSCVKSINTQFSTMKSVLSTEINLEKEMGKFTFTCDITVPEIIQTIEDCGFDVSVYSSTEDLSSSLPQSKSKISPKKNSLTPPNSSTITIQIHGMTCASCVKTIESHLNDHPSVFNCSVSLALETAEVIFDSQQITPLEIVGLVDELGFEAKLQDNAELGTVEIRILGMTCASCSSSIEKKITSMDGVKSASVSVLNQNGFFEITKSKIGLRDLVEAIEELGFQAFMPEKGANSQLESLSRTKEIKKWREAFWGSLSLAIPVSLTAMVLPHFIPGVLHYNIIPGISIGVLIQFLFATPVQYGFGMTYHVKAYKSISHSSYTMDVLISLGTNLAYIFSILSILNSVYRGGFPAPEVFFETSSTLITFVTLGRYLENQAKAKTSNALSKLISLAPAHANLLEKGEIKQIPAEYIKQGDLLKILPGERLPCDGRVEFGKSEVDESLVTGEPLPLLKEIGDKVIAGTVNVSSVIHVVAERVGGDTTLSQIVKLVSSAQASKAPIQATADKVSSIFVPVIIALGCMTFIAWLAIIEGTGWIPSSFPPDSNHFFVCLSMCISVIVVACPCALGLATPTATMVGTGVGAKLGILIKGGVPLEMAHKITKVVFDKTGTLTFGKMSVYSYDCLPSCNIPRIDLLAMIGLVETNSEHPIGKSIVAFCPPPPYKDTIVSCESIPGSGITATVKSGKSGKSHQLIIGNLKYMDEMGCNSSPELGKMERSHAIQGRTVIFIAVDGSVAALISLADTIKPEANAVVKCLKKMGIKVAMITGDQELTAGTIAHACGITEVHAGVSPAGKQELVAAMQLTDCVAMIGDGVNDSASLAQSDMGIAVYGGTDVALAAASVVLMRPDLKDVVTAIDLSKTIMNRIWMNFFFATAYNITMVPLAMGFGAPWGITLPAMVTGLAMSMSSVSVVVSSLLLQMYTRPIISNNGELSRNSQQFYGKGSTDLNVTTSQLSPNPAPQSSSLRQLISAASGLLRKNETYRKVEYESDDELHLL